MTNSSIMETYGLHTEGVDAPETERWPALVGGKWKTGGNLLPIRNPYNNEIISEVYFAGGPDLEEAVRSAVQSFEITRHLPSWRRSEILELISEAIKDRRENFARTIALEAGKPISAARAEVDRATFTFKVAAEEAKRIYGEIVPLDWLPGAESRVAHVRHVPRGPVVGITPFNYPLNLVAHKVAPALAVGNPMILRPAPQTPVTALKLGEVILEAGWPPQAISVIPTSVEDAALLVEDGRIKLLTFTGSAPVGWSLKSRAGTKPVTLELGGNAATIVHGDANLQYAAARIAWGGFTCAGQACISVQRVYAHADIYDRFLQYFLPEVRSLKVGDPLNEKTDVGPVIDSRAAERIEAWIKEATDEGANILAGGNREGNLWEATVLDTVSDTVNLSAKEVFGPVVCLYKYTDLNDALRRANGGDFGLQAGLFTDNLHVVEQAFDQLDVGGLMVNDVSTFRMDHMPYGGVKHSGLGREGLRYAIQEMTELKLLTMNHSI